MEAVVQRQTEQYIEISEQKRCLNKYWFGREVARMCDTYHYSVHPEEYFQFGQNGTFL